MAKTTLDHMMRDAQDVLTVRRVFGEPVKKRGITLIPAAAVRGGGGGGQGEGPEEGQEGSGGGFGAAARPIGAYVIRGDDVQWKPAIDLGRVGLLTIAVAAIVAVTVGALLKTRS